MVYRLASYYFGNSANRGRSLFSSASAYKIAQRLRYGAIYGVMCSALKAQCGTKSGESWMVSRKDFNPIMPQRAIFLTSRLKMTTWEECYSIVFHFMSIYFVKYGDSKSQLVQNVILDELHL